MKWVGLLARIGAVTVAVLLFAGVALAQADETATPSASPAAEATPTFTRLNINTASDEELLSIPGVGDRMLDEFLEYRPFTSIVQFRREIGKYVDDDQVAEWETYIYVPVDPNSADVETLMQLPGVTEQIAQQLIDGREYASNDEFLGTLATLVSASDAAAAAPYLATAP